MTKKSAFSAACFTTCHRLLIKDAVAWWLLKRATEFQVTNRIGTSTKGTVMRPLLGADGILDEVDCKGDDLESDREALLPPAITSGANI